MSQVDLSGSGSGTATMVAFSTGPLAFSGEGTLTDTYERPVILTMQLTIPYPEVEQPPAQLEVFLSEGWPFHDIVFSIDGVQVMWGTINEDGTLGPVSLPIAETMATGSHTVTAVSLGAEDSIAASATFTVLYGSILAPEKPAADLEPVTVATSRWVFQDLAPGGLGSWVMPANPVRMSNPHVDRVLQAEPTTAVEGQFHVFESGIAPVEWSFTGVLQDEATYNQLVAFSELKRRFYIIDHRQRAWEVTILSLDIAPRLRTHLNGALTDWVQDYTVRALVYDQNWRTPQ